MEVILIKSHFSDWHKVTRKQAKEFVKFIYQGIVAIKEKDKIDYINKKYLKGTTVQELLK